MEESEVFESAWPDGLKAGQVYEVLCDDKGREGGSWLRVYVAADGDVHIAMQDWEEVKSNPESKPSPFPHIRIRTFAGGGRNHRTHQALLWLAEAIRRDNDDAR